MLEKNVNRPKLPIRMAKKALSLTAVILLELIEQQRDMNFLYSHRYHFSRPIRELRRGHEYFEARREEYRRKQAVERLRQNKLVELRKVGNRVVAVLTDDGRVKALKTIITASLSKLPEAGTCIVSFDFPEAARSARRRFRCFLKQTGFKFVQGSVWSIDKDVVRELKMLVSILRIGPWVKIYIAGER
jgi:hypothetical protein